MQGSGPLGGPGKNFAIPPNSGTNSDLRQFLNAHFPQRADIYSAACDQQKIASIADARDLSADELVEFLDFSEEDALRFVALIAKPATPEPEADSPPEKPDATGHGIAMAPLSMQVLGLLPSPLPVSPKTPPHDIPEKHAGADNKPALQNASPQPDPHAQQFEDEVCRVLRSLGEDPAQLIEHLRCVEGHVPQNRKEWEAMQNSDIHQDHQFQIAAVLENLDWPDAPKEKSDTHAMLWEEQVRREFRNQQPIDSWTMTRPGVKIMLPDEALDPMPPPENISRSFDPYLPTVVTFPGGTDSLVCTVAPDYSAQGHVNSAHVMVNSDKGDLRTVQIPFPAGGTCTVVEILKSGDIRKVQPDTPGAGHLPDKDVSARLVWTGDALLVDAFPGPISVLDGSEQT